MKRQPERPGSGRGRNRDKAGWMFLVLLVVVLVFGSWVIFEQTSMQRSATVDKPVLEPDKAGTGN